MAFTEGRIQTLDNLVNNAVITEKDRSPSGVAGVGATVTVQDQNGTTFQYTITGSTEADPSQGKISNVSPIGQSLLGKKVGELAEVSAPAGRTKLEIIAID